MFKKILTASLVLAASTGVASVSYAHMPYKGMRDYKAEVVPAPCCKRTFTCGPYIGLSAGVRSNYIHTPAVFHGIEGTLSVGYASMFTPEFYLGAEFFGADNFEASDYRIFGLNSVRTTWTYGFSLLPGYLITDNFLAYLRASVVRSRFNHFGENRTGWQLGIGAETNLCDCWDLRLEYIYSQYGHLHHHFDRDNLETFSSRHHAIPRSDQFNIGVLYKFA